MSFLSNSYVFRLQRYYFLIKYAIFLRKIRFFYKNICSMYAGYALSFSETVVPSDAALLLYHTYWRSCLPCTALPYSRTAAYPQFNTPPIHEIGRGPRRGAPFYVLRFFPQSGNSSGAILEVPFKALLHAKCCKYALFLYKNAFFSKNICVFAFFVVPLHPISAWCHRLSVRTRDFHSLKRGSIPRGTTDNNKL